MAESIQKNKVLVLKLGGQCNLHCKYCHCKRVNYKLNRDIFKYISDNGFTHITFSGGEPFLYWSIIKEVLEYFGTSITYKIVTNGNLLNSEIVETCNKYNVQCFVSYDGANNDSRDYYSFIEWNDFSKLNRHGFATLFSKSNEDIDKLFADRDDIISHYDLKISKGFGMINFPHSTQINTNPEVDKELAKKYCLIICRFLELEFIELSKSGFRGDYGTRGFPIISSVFKRFIEEKSVRGVKCCNETILPMTIDGRFLLCPYDEQYVGDIYTGIDWNKVESYIPDRCKGCPQWKSCMNSCIANITDNECYIHKVIYKHFYKLMDKYNVTYDFLKKEIKRVY